MSNLERDPAELVMTCGPHADSKLSGVTVLPAREVPLGGPRAMNVRRTLPSRGRSLIGAWCFLDHYGPSNVDSTSGMRVPPHPHTGLQTVSWLFAGEIEHRDSVGSHAFIEPGTLNLMTAGRGISHSEVSTTATTVLHGVQLWLALPETARGVEPFFETHTAPLIGYGPADIRVFLGSLVGLKSSATVFSPVVAAQIDLPAGASITLPVEIAFEHGILVDTGSVTVNARKVEATELAYLEPGAAGIRLLAGDEPVRLILIGGEPFGEKIVMWWNFVARNHDEIVAYRTAWQVEALGETSTATRTETGTAEPSTTATSLAEVGVSGQGATKPLFPSAQAQGKHSYEGSPLPAPTLPTVRLMPRG